MRVLLLSLNPPPPSRHWGSKSAFVILSRLTLPLLLLPLLLHPPICPDSGSAYTPRSSEPPDSWNRPGSSVSWAKKSSLSTPTPLLFEEKKKTEPTCWASDGVRKAGRKAGCWRTSRGNIRSFSLTTFPPFWGRDELQGRTSHTWETSQEFSLFAGNNGEWD